MDYHHRYNKDGSYEIICTRCFLTVGLAGEDVAGRKLEAQHNCPRANFANAAPRLSRNYPRSIRPALSRLPTRGLMFVATAKQARFTLLAIAVIFVFYALPTGLEFIATPYLGPWVGTIFLGDLCGCICLATVFNLRRTSVILYVVLTTCEGVLYAGRLLPGSALLWITDLVPTIVVAAKVVRLHGPGMHSSLD
jgi:hypothetical protein